MVYAHFYCSLVLYRYYKHPSISVATKCVCFMKYNTYSLSLSINLLDLSKDQTAIYYVRLVYGGGNWDERDENATSKGAKPAERLKTRVRKKKENTNAKISTRYIIARKSFTEKRAARRLLVRTSPTDCRVPRQKLRRNTPTHQPP